MFKHLIFRLSIAWQQYLWGLTAGFIFTCPWRSIFVYTPFDAFESVLLHRDTTTNTWTVWLASLRGEFCSNNTRNLNGCRRSIILGETATKPQCGSTSRLPPEDVISSEASTYIPHSLSLAAHLLSCGEFTCGLLFYYPGTSFLSIYAVAVRPSPHGFSDTDDILSVVHHTGQIEHASTNGPSFV